MLLPLSSITSGLDNKAMGYALLGWDSILGQTLKLISHIQIVTSYEFMELSFITTYKSSLNHEGNGYQEWVPVDCLLTMGLGLLHLPYSLLHINVYKC
jgi:hypothetical protein